MEEEEVTPVESVDPEVVEESSTVIIHQDQWSLLMEQDELEKTYYQDSTEQLSTLNDNITSLNDMVGSSAATSITYEQAETIILYLETALELGGYVVAAAAIWFVLKMLYRLFGGVLFGGV